LATIPPAKKIQFSKGNGTLIIPRNKGEEDKLVLSPDAIGWHQNQECDDGFIGLEPKTEDEYKLVCWEMPPFAHSNPLFYHNIRATASVLPHNPLGLMVCNVLMRPLILKAKGSAHLHRPP
jgi:hypothetical protein